MRLNPTTMAWALRFGRTLLLVLVVGCSAAPATLPAQQATAAQPVAPTMVDPMLTAAEAVAGTVGPAPDAPAQTPGTRQNSAAEQNSGTAESPGAGQNLALPPASAVEPAVTAQQAQADGTLPTSAQSPGTAQDSGSAPAAVVAPAAAAQPEPGADSTCDDTARPDPLPSPGSPRSPDFFRSFRLPLPPAPLYDPPGPRRVGLQAGHWLTDEVPPELGRLQGGSAGGGKQEWEVNLDIAQRAAALLQGAGVQVDVLPATVPPGYRANAFIALHADGDPAGAANGFKVARPGFSSLPDVDDRLVDTLDQVYAADTELPRDDEHISLRMRYYYAFNSRRYCHAVAPGVPQAIIEMGYLTSPIDRRLLIGDPDRLARGLADSIQAFLSTLP
jgi:N-acetylmuramoyl-L-alanine amidase